MVNEYLFLTNVPFSQTGTSPEMKIIYKYKDMLMTLNLAARQGLRQKQKKACCEAGPLFCPYLLKVT
jgi:hypothetical protein